MANLDDINDKDLCTNISTINGKAITNIVSVNEILKSCTTCTAVELAYDRSNCENACRERCSEYYTDGDPTDGFVLGDKIFRDSNCTVCAVDGYYSDVPCRGRNGCITVASCAIIRIDACR